MFLWCIFWCLGFKKRRWSQWQALLGATPGFPESVFRLGSPRPSKCKQILMFSRASWEGAIPWKYPPTSNHGSIFSRESNLKLHLWLAFWVGGSSKIHVYTLYIIYNCDIFEAPAISSGFCFCSRRLCCLQGFSGCFFHILNRKSHGVGSAGSDSTFTELIVLFSVNQPLIFSGIKGWTLKKQCGEKFSCL